MVSSLNSSSKFAEVYKLVNDGNGYYKTGYVSLASNHLQLNQIERKIITDEGCEKRIITRRNTENDWLSF